jgi:hypothetical protein
VIDPRFALLMKSIGKMIEMEVSKKTKSRWYSIAKSCGFTSKELNEHFAWKSLSRSTWCRLPSLQLENITFSNNNSVPNQSLNGDNQLLLDNITSQTVPLFPSTPKRKRTKEAICPGLLPYLSQFFQSQAIHSPVENKMTMPHSMRRLHKILCSQTDLPTKLSWTTFRRIWRQYFKKDYRKAKHRDGLCQLCEIGHKLEKCSSIPLWKKQTIQRHKLSNERSKRLYDNQVQQLKPGAGILIIDFKENVNLGIGPRELGQSWYKRERRTILGLVLLHKEADGVLNKYYFNFISTCLTHDAIFVQFALWDLFQFDCWKDFDINNLVIWCDNGPHFKNKLFLRYLFKMKIIYIYL